MKIKLLTPIAGQHGGKAFAYSEGEVVDWPDKADAERLIRAGYAEAVEAEAVEAEAVEAEAPAVKPKKTKAE